MTPPSQLAKLMAVTLVTAITVGTGGCGDSLPENDPDTGLANYDPDTELATLAPATDWYSTWVKTYDSSAFYWASEELGLNIYCDVGDAGIVGHGAMYARRKHNAWFREGVFRGDEYFLALHKRDDGVSVLNLTIVSPYEWSKNKFRNFNLTADVPRGEATKVVVQHMFERSVAPVPRKGVRSK